MSFFLSENCSVLVSSNADIKPNRLVKSQMISRKNPTSVSSSKAINRGGPMRVLHPLNDTSYKCHDELDQTADDFMISELIKWNVKDKYETVSKEIHRRITEVWFALNQLLAQVDDLQSENRSLQEKLKFFDQYESIKDEMERVTNNFPLDVLRELKQGLEHCTHQMKVKDVSMKQGVDYKIEMTKLFKDNIKPYETSKDAQSMAQKILQVKEYLKEAVATFEECRLAATLVNDKEIHLQSLKGQSLPECSTFRLRSAMSAHMP